MTHGRCLALQTGNANIFGVVDLHFDPVGYKGQFVPEPGHGNGTYTDSGAATCHGAPAR